MQMGRGTMVRWYIPYITKNHQRPIYMLINMGRGTLQKTHHNIHIQTYTHHQCKESFLI